MMLAYKLVGLIEAHSEELATGLLEKIQCSPLLPDYWRVPTEELKQRVSEIYRNLGDWLLGKPPEIKARYKEIGARRAAQHVPLCQLIWAIVLTKENLWEFLELETALDRPVDIYAELETLRLLDQFFDRAQYYAALGYGQARNKQHALTPLERDKPFEEMKE
jgi:hypothetical protein